MLIHGLILSLSAVLGVPPGNSDLYGAELDSLARMVAKDLSGKFPPSEHDLARWEQYQTALMLAAVWPRPEFRESLLVLLESDRASMVARAAEGLLNYNDPELSDRVWAMTTDERLWFGDCIGQTVGASVAAVIASHEDGVRFSSTRIAIAGDPATTSRSQAVSFPARAQGIITLPDAIDGLAHANVSIRLQAFVWLKSRRIVLTTEPLDEAWMRLNEETRRWALGYVDRRMLVGAERLATAYERLWRQADSLSSRERSLLVWQLAVQGSNVAHQAAIAQLASLAARQEPIDDGNLTPWDFALRAAIDTAGPADREAAMTWIRDANPHLRLGGYGLLASLDDPRAMEVVAAYLTDRTISKPLFSMTDPLEILQRRPWTVDATRWYYARLLLRMLQMPDDPGYEFRKCGYPTDRLIDALNLITGVVHGSNGATVPNGYDAMAATGTISAIERWVTTHDPAKKSNHRETCQSVSTGPAVK